MINTPIFQFRCRSKSCVLILTLLFWRPILSAQTNQKAEDVIDATIRYYQGFDDISANFTYRDQLKNSDVINHQMMGTIFMKDSLFVVSMDGLEMRSDGLDIYTITSENREVYRSSIRDSEQLPFHLLNLLSYLQTHFEARVDLDENDFNDQTHYITLTPHHQTESIDAIFLMIDRKTSELLTLRMAYSDHTISSISFDNHIYNRGLATDFFVFNPDDYPDYTIIE